MTIEFYDVHQKCTSHINPICWTSKENILLVSKFLIKFLCVINSFYQLLGKFVQNIEIKIEFGLKEVLALSRKKVHSIVDILSLIGGFLGLFAGFSFLSASEIINNFIIDPLIKIKTKRSTKVHPFTVNKIRISQQNSNYLWTYFKHSSIHSFKHVANSDRNWIERIIWSILFIISMSCAFVLIWQVYSKLKSSEIVMNLERVPTKVEDVNLYYFLKF